MCLCVCAKACTSARLGPSHPFAVELRSVGTRAPLERTARVPCSRHGRVPLSTLDGVPLESPSNPPRVPREYPLSTLQPCRVPGEYPPGAKSTCASSSPAGSRACSTACCRPRCEIPENLPTKRRCAIPRAEGAINAARESLSILRDSIVSMRGPCKRVRGAINNRARRY